MNTSGDYLEFASLKELLGRYIASPLGQAELDHIEPLDDRARVEQMLREAAEAKEYLDTAARPQPASRGAAVRIRFGELADTTESVRKLRIEGASLEAKEILELTGLLDRASDIRSVLLAVAQRFPKLGARAAAMGEFRSLLRDLVGKILPDGTVADHASVLLGRLRRDIERQKLEIQNSLERFLRAHREEGVLQEEFVTIRNERFVVPVIAGQRRKIDGVIHGASGTGHTLFVEPLETIELNNELVRLAEEEMREVHRILLEYTQRLREYADAISRTIGILGELEMLFAKAEFALAFGCTIPRFSNGEARRLALRDARHPLLEDVLRRQRKQVVPVSLELEGSTRTLLISGPNSGGKTVTLKTVGLLALMAQAGLPVPCAEAEFPFFDQVLADMGDQQSIQESLSTFSAHMSRVRDIVTEVTPDSLILLDELGRATDPEEGGALGVAILDRCRASGAFSLASTHLLALKIYGANTQGVLNGSMGFNEETLEPTYVLRLGAPGKSAGIDIARRLGLPQALLERARAALSTREQDLARFLSELDRRLKDVAQLQEGLERERERLVAREKAVAEEWAKKESAKIKELERQCKLVLERFEEQAQETLGKIASGGGEKKAAVQAQRSVAKVKRELREEMESAVLSTRADALEPLKIVEGARVRLKGVREPARVRRLIGADRLEVEAGFLKMQVSRDEVLEVLPGPGEGAKLPQNVSFKPAGPDVYVSMQEINVIGERAEAARERVDKFLDSALLASVNRVRIVHGHGMGILKRVIAELLAAHPSVEKFYPAPQSEGGAGATIAELKE
ncbi:MAG: endonuclease MutS2 [Bryobacteraceae bacterium]|jgi:DNA mismatch repair protein MutS2